MDLSFVCLDPHSSRNHVYEIINDEDKFPKSFPKELEETIEIVYIFLKRNALQVNILVRDFYQINRRNH